MGIKNTEIEVEESDSQSEDEEVHKKLLLSIGVDLDSAKTDHGKQERTEATKDISVFSISSQTVENSSSKIRLNDLMKGLKETVNINNLKKKITRVQHPDRSLDAPLSKPAAERLHRKVEYEKNKKELKKWDAVVQKNRKAEQLTFPLNQQPLRIAQVDEHVASTKASNLTPLEQEIYSLLHGNKFAERPDHDLSVAEEAAMAAMSLEDARERRAELQKHRALMSYHESKNKRIHKIKSKQYHRMLKKKKKKEMTELEVDGGDVEKGERMRAEERASLRHRTGSKWARNRALMAKHDSNTKHELQEQLNKHRELTQKVPEVLEDLEENDEKDESSDDEGFEGRTFTVSEDNPWLRSVPEEEGSKDQTEDTGDVGKNVPLDEKNGGENKSLEDETEGEKEVVEHVLLKEEIIPPTLSEEEVLKPSRRMLRSWLIEKNTSPEAFEIQFPVKDTFSKFQKACVQLKEEVLAAEEEICEKKVEEREEEDEEGNDEGLIETIDGVDDNVEEVVAKVRKLVEKSEDNVGNVKRVEVSAEKSFNVAETDLSKTEATFVENAEDFDDQKMTIQQAFADDDVIADFTATKRKLIDDEAPKKVDLSLPGWGAWGGAGVQPTRKRKRRFKPLPPRKPRKDGGLGSVIINEKRDVHISKHQVNQVPHPFTSMEQFERTITRPIGGTWNTPHTVKEMTKPKVVTQIGAIIDPMNKSEAFEECTDSKSKLKFVNGKKDSRKNKRKLQRNENLMKLKS
uniref:U3 small nucleolar RNA-associated protein 14 homolog A n=1 Tax=Ciona intestinalis TaxID=7719 RepID=UPI000180C0CE|nr:U3 small nucleolar RNA-associated protein 14 homolog A [Ciona intestinalis]|eukprot:XP_002119548.1 U3 small nucleolar RNA-associated protein 14 homolog A [Ciona intestinalis]